MKKIFSLLVAISFVFVFTSCSLIPTTTPSGTASPGYPDSVVYKMTLSNVTYLCSSFNVINTDAGITLKLNEAYSLSSDGKVTWIGTEKDISAVKIEKVSK
jgi:hypothetical protein